MNYWFLAIIILQVLSLGVNLAKHGEVNESRYNFGFALFAALLNLLIIFMAITTGF